MDQKFETYKKWQPFLLGICAALGLWAGLNMKQIHKTESGRSDELKTYFDQSQKIKDALSFVQSKYLDSINPNLATDLVLSSYLASLDPYSEYIPVDKMRLYSDQINGKSRGLGFKFIRIDSLYTVSQIQTKSPAYIAGLRVGDKLLIIDSIHLDSGYFNCDSILSEIDNSGEDSFLIKWKSNSSEEIQETILLNDQWAESPVCCAHSPAPGVLYVKLQQLSKDSYRLFMRTVEQYFETRHYKHLIIDLRDNSGGLVHEAAFILNQLITEKNIIMFKTSGNKVKDKEYRSTGKPFFEIDKIVVLVNQETASAAELIAAALQDVDRAIIIGQATLGKATVLEQFSLGDGSAIRLAISRFYTYSGRSIQKKYEENPYVEYLGNSNWNADTNYLSLKKRKLNSHQGVIPDFLLSLEKTSTKEITYTRHHADLFVGKHFDEFKTILQDNPDHIFKNRKVEQLLRNELLKFYPLKKQTSLYQLADDECRYALARWFFEPELEKRIRLTKDEYLQTALEILSR